jgi:L-threonylcarbamoyladenylate synthase
MIEDAVLHLKKGKVIVYPTDTIYGLGADALNEKAIERIFEIKGREKKIAISVAVCSIDMAKEFAEIDESAERLFLRYMPGALTLVVRNKEFPEILTGRTGKIGIRMPDDRIALEIIERFGKPITATSANKHGMPPARTVDEAKEQLGDSVEVYVDGGLREGLPSTVYDCVKKKVIREGSINVTESYL